MTVQIPGVPESITREAYNKLIESLGLKLNDLYALRFESKGIFATVLARDKNGNAHVIEDEIAMHEIFIPVVEEKA